MAKDKVTTEFKRDRLFMYCLNQPRCENCVLCVGGWDVRTLLYSEESCLLISKATKRDIDRAYDLIENALTED